MTCLLRCSPLRRRYSCQHAPASTLLPAPANAGRCRALQQHAHQRPLLVLQDGTRPDLLATVRTLFCKRAQCHLLAVVLSQDGTRPDLLATSGDFLRIWRITDDASGGGGVRLEKLLNNVSRRCCVSFYCLTTLRRHMRVFVCATVGQRLSQ